MFHLSIINLIFGSSEPYFFVIVIGLQPYNQNIIVLSLPSTKRFYTSTPTLMRYFNKKTNNAIIQKP